MPRKSLDIRSTDHPLAWERDYCSFSCLRRGRVWAEPSLRVKGRVPCRFLGQRPKPSESLQFSISTDFQGSFEPFSLALFFHKSLDTTGRTIHSKLNLLKHRRELLQCYSICPSHNLRVVLESATAKGSQYQYICPLRSCTGQHVNGSLYMIPEKLHIVHIGTITHKRCMDI